MPRSADKPRKGVSPSTVGLLKTCRTFLLNKNPEVIGVTPNKLGKVVQITHDATKSANPSILEKER